VAVDQFLKFTHIKPRPYRGRNVLLPGLLGQSTDDETVKLRRLFSFQRKSLLGEQRTIHFGYTGLAYRSVRTLPGLTRFDIFGNDNRLI
jgi:hypothetical protein